MAGAGEIFSGTWVLLHQILSGIESAVSDSEETSFSVGGAVSGLKDMLLGLGRSIIGTRDIISGTSNVVSTWKGSFSPELEEMLEEGVKAFSVEFKEIIKWLEKNAPNATIIVNTIYNPIPQDVLWVSLPISHWANGFIGSMNHIIVEESMAKGFLVTDIHSQFTNRPNLMRLNLNPFVGSFSFDILHPNIKGHRLIAELNYATFKQNTQGK